VMEGGVKEAIKELEEKEVVEKAVLSD